MIYWKQHRQKYLIWFPFGKQAAWHCWAHREVWTGLRIRYSSRLPPRLRSLPIIGSTVCSSSRLFKQSPASPTCYANNECWFRVPYSALYRYFDWMRIPYSTRTAPVWRGYVLTDRCRKFCWVECWYSRYTRRGDSAAGTLRCSFILVIAKDLCGAVG